MSRARRVQAVVAVAVAATGLGASALALTQRSSGEQPAAAATASAPPETAAAAPSVASSRADAGRPLAARPGAEPVAPAPAAAAPPSAPEPQETAAARAEAPHSDLSDDRLDKPVFDAHGRRLPAGTPWALPPIIRLHAASAAPAEPAPALAGSVLRSRRFALSPAARRNVEGGRVAPAALALLLRLRGNGPPVLVHAARGADLRIQETTLQGTQATVSLLDALPAGAAPADLRLKSVRAGFADAGTGRVDAGDPGSTGRAAANLALQYLGIPYVWGGATPEQGLDCSGLVQYVYGKLGIPLTHYAAFQFREGDPVASQDLRPGDLVFFNPKADGPGHVGIYIGNGMMVHAPRRGDVVRIADLASRAGRYMGAVRPY